MGKRILASLQFVDYKLIPTGIFEKLTPIKFHDTGSLENTSYAYFSDRVCLVGA